MDVNDILDTSSSGGDDLIVTGEIRGFLGETARWAKFIAIVAFVMLGLSLLIVVLGGSAFGMMAAMEGMPGGGGAIGGFFMVIYVIIIVIYFLPVLYLYRFAVNTQRALQIDDQGYLRSAFENLKSHYKFIGILMAIFVGLYAIMIVFSLIAGIGGVIM